MMTFEEWEETYKPVARRAAEWRLMSSSDALKPIRPKVLTKWLNRRHVSSLRLRGINSSLPRGWRVIQPKGFFAMAIEKRCSGELGSRNLQALRDICEKLNPSQVNTLNNCIVGYVSGFIAADVWDQMLVSLMEPWNIKPDGTED
jgi:hypothetical protein